MRADTVWMDLTPYDAADARGRLAPEDVEDLSNRLLSDAGVTRQCPELAATPGRYAAGDISQAWLLGHPPVSDGNLSTQDEERVRTGWVALTCVPPAQQVQRVSAMRQALLTCQGDPYALLTKGGAQ